MRHSLSILALSAVTLWIVPGAKANDVPVCERSLVVRMTIERELAKPCEDIALSELPTLKSGTSSDWTFDARPLLPGDFSGLTGITTAQFYAMSADFDSRIIGDLTGLTSLQITAVGATVPADLLKGLVKLKGFRLHNRDLKELPPTLFATNAQLQEIDISNNQLTELPAWLLAKLWNLLSVRLTYAQIQAIPKDFFRTNIKLRSVDLRNNQITRIDSDLFSKNPDLTSINLEANKLTEFPANICAGTPKMQHLSFSKNQIHTLTAPVCPQSPYFSSVGFVANGLTSLDPKHFLPTDFSAKARLFILKENQLDDETVAQLRSILGDRLE